ncbi:hypothetical protein [Pseudoxanthomonas mexicana]
MTIKNQEEPRERMFDPSKFPVGDAATHLVTAAVALVQSREKRQRARRGADKARFAAAVSALVLDLAYWRRSFPDGWLYVSMTKADYTPATRRAPFLTEAFPDLVHMMRKARLLQVRMGTRGVMGEGRLTTIRAGKALRILIDEADLGYGAFGRDATLQGDPLVLRSVKNKGVAEDLPIPETEQADALRSEVLTINEWLNAAEIGWGTSNGEAYGGLDTGFRFMRRHFTGSLDGCGRLNGGFWQAMGKESRLGSLMIDGDLIAELDYGQIGLRIAYSRVGAQPPSGDLYSIPGLEEHRERVKHLINALLARSALPTRFPQGMRDWFPNWRFRDVYERIKARHEAITPLFGSSFYLTEQRVESEILIACIHRMRELGLHGLPIHDCLLVAMDCAPQVKEIMETAAYEALGVHVPVEIHVHEGFQHYLDAVLAPDVESLPPVGTVTAVGTDEPASNNTIGTLSVPHEKGA